MQPKSQKNFKRENAMELYSFYEDHSGGHVAVETDWSQEHQVGDGLLLTQVRDGGGSWDEEK